MKANLFPAALLIYCHLEKDGCQYHTGLLQDVSLFHTSQNIEVRGIFIVMWYFSVLCNNYAFLKMYENKELQKGFTIISPASGRRNHQEMHPATAFLRSESVNETV
jgi:hypothetical protein